MATITLNVTDQDGGQHHIAAKTGDHLMHALKEAGLDIPAICGGNCTCSTCQVYVEASWFDQLPTPSDEEQELLDEEAYLPRPTSRLGCQIELSEDMDGLSLALPPLD